MSSALLLRKAGPDSGQIGLQVGDHVGAILRLAESLDRSRHGTIRGLTVNTSADQVLVELEGRGDAELEMWAANRQLAPLERVIERPVRLQVRIVDDPEPAAKPRRTRATPAGRAAAAR